MNATFISPIIGRASELGVSYYEDNQPVELFPGASLADMEMVINAVYRQVLGNAYVMESERLAIPESKLKEGSISVREFIRQVAKSELYKSRFFDNCPRYRSIELNFKHLFGRAPDSYEEMNTHSQILDRGGYEAEIDSYLDSDEYQEQFGEWLVPYYRGYKTQTGKNIVGFTHLFKLLRGASSSDKNLTSIRNSSRLTNSLLNNNPSAIIPPSTADSYGGVTDVNKLIADALRPKATPASAKARTIPSSYSSGNSQSYSAIEQQDREQQKQIEQLEKELANLNSSANIGLASIGKWQSSKVSANGDRQNYNSFTADSSNLESKVATQEKTIQQLKEKIADARRFAAIGEARLNKWRSRSFF